MRFDPLLLGHINQSIIVTTVGAGRFLLQKINREIFRDIAALMENLQRVTEHLRGSGVASLRLMPTKDGGRFYREAVSGDCWRMFPFIEGSSCTSHPRSPVQAERTAAAFGDFSRRLADLPAPPLHVTIPDFHNPPKRIADLVATVEQDPVGRAAGAGSEIDAAMAAASWAEDLVAGGGRGQEAPPERVAHNDAKIENVLFDRTGSRVLCIVDLDTVMPGSLLHDFGDLVRSCAATAGEEERDLERIGASMQMFTALARGFIAACGDSMTGAERAGLPLAGRLLAYEQALRFLTDHLNGDSYYRIQRGGQNLDRARNQLALAAALTREEPALIEICERAFDTI